MKLVDTLHHLHTFPRYQDDNRYTSDFVEWFYLNVFLGYGEKNLPILTKIKEDPEYSCIQELCQDLINHEHTNTLDDTKIMKHSKNMKKWTIEMIEKYSQN